MGPDLKDECRLDKEASGNQENVCSMKELENKNVRCASNYEDTSEMEALMDEQTLGMDRSEDVEVNVLECTSSGEIGLVEAEYQEATENSSSFDDTVSVFENGAMLSDAEFESELHGDASLALPFGGVGEFFRMRRKKVTPHWRRFIRPLMWRCKWVELQIRKCQSQAMKCDRMLEKYNQRKQIELEKCTLEGCGARSFPFSGQNRRKEVIKRKKRKRVEDTVDIASYMSHHNLFSYYENKRSTAASMDDDWGNREKAINGNDDFGNGELLSLESKDGDNSLEHILQKIGIVQSRVSNMKSRMNKIEDGVLIDNHRAREELNDFKEFHSQPVEKRPVPKQEQDSSIPSFHVLEPDLLTDDQQAPKMRSISKLSAAKNKGKRGKQQAGSSRLSRQSKG